jgi:hypothetical protein
MIRQEHHARSNQPNNHGRTPSHHSSSAVIDDGPPRAGRSPSLPRNGHHSQQDMPHPHIHTRSRSPLLAYGSLSRQSSIRDQSQTSSHTGSPALRPTSAALSSHNESNEFLIGSPASTRDESAFYQAETQMLTRENQMLKLRIRELGTLSHSATNDDANVTQNGKCLTSTRRPQSLTCLLRIPTWHGVLRFVLPVHLSLGQSLKMLRWKVE